MSSDSFHLAVFPATPAQQADALRLLLRDYPPVHRANQVAALLREASAGLVSLEALVIAAQAGQIHGVAWANPVPGGLGGIWPPQLAPAWESNEDLARRLIAAAEETLLKSTRIVLWQASIGIHDTSASQRLQASGYRPLTELIHLLTSAPRPPRATYEAAIQFVNYRPCDLERLCQVIEATYEGTLDCPELDHLRSTADCVAGYGAIGNSGEEHWYLVQHEGIDIGCLLLAAHAGGPSELIYMGLRKPYRSRGWGRLLVEKAVEVGQQLGDRGLMTSVDRRNVPALKAYQGVGFREWERREILIKSLQFLQ